MYAAENIRMAVRALRRGGPLGLGRLGLSWACKELEPDVVPLLPPFVHLEVSTRCNLHCLTCVRAAVKGGKDLALAQAVRILDQVPDAAKVVLYGIGEPLLNRDFVPMLRAARDRDLYAGFFTNLTLLNEANVAALVAARPAYVSLSMDGGTKAVFEKFRVGAVFEKCVAGARRLVGAVRRAGLPTAFVIWFGATDENIADLPALVHLARDLGVDTIAVQDLMDWNVAAVTEVLAGHGYHDGDRGRFEAAFARTRVAARETGVAVWHHVSAGTGVRTCGYPWVYTFITVDGLVAPCPWLAYDGAVSFGNAFAQPLAEIWASPAYRAFRRELRGPTRPALCRGCPYYDRHVTRIG
jgi:MoaA/NifB/PqqE/SkfB family radical SAM enzyme